MRTVTIFIAAFALGLSFAGAQPATQGHLTLDGDVSNTLNWSVDDLRKLPRSEEKIKTDAGNEITYEGVRLADLLVLGGVPIRQQLKGADVAKYLHAEGADGFVAVFSLPEFDVGKVLVADRINGQDLQPSDGPLQLVSPEEIRRSRWVKHVQLLRIIRSTQ